MTTRTTRRPASKAADAPASVTLPTRRPSRTVVEAVSPVVDGGDFAAKASIGRPVRVVADVFTDGHDVVAAELTTRSAGGTIRTTPMTAQVNDRFVASFVPDALGRWSYDVSGWVAHAETWRRGTAKKIAAELDVSVELLIGIARIDEMLTTPHDAATAEDLDDLTRFRAELANGVTESIGASRWAEVFHRCEPRDAAQFARPLHIDVDPELGTVGAWYSFFPRSTVGGSDGDSATLRDAIGRLDYIADMGFDVVYIPPVHPIGTTNRKGKNNTTDAEPTDVGSPYAIGSPDGGHCAVAPELGTVDDVAALAAGCRERGMELALDIAFNCSPDHPWVRDHPDWFVARPDGTIQYAENPPKKYEDIYPLDFETADWQGLWTELANVFRFWIGQGVKVFRVDNPHTKSFAFWEWALHSIRTDHPDAIFLSEAFTKPRVMQRLAKVGFNQSYTYFAWRHTAWELRQYFEELSSETIDYLRPNAWPNTHDILTEHLQHGGRAGFIGRAVLAATLSPSWGIYGPVFELMETAPRPGVEDYLDSEKYQIRHWNLDRPDSLAPLISRLNEIRREQPALTDLASIRFHQTDNENILCFTKVDPAGDGDPVLVVVNLDPHNRQAGYVDIDLAAVRLAYGSEYDLIDQLGGARYRWTGNFNYVELSPHGAMAHVFTVHGTEFVDPDASLTAVH